MPPSVRRVAVRSPGFAPGPHAFRSVRVGRRASRVPRTGSALGRFVRARACRWYPNCLPVDCLRSADSVPGRRSWIVWETLSRPASFPRAARSGLGERRGGPLVECRRSRSGRKVEEDFRCPRSAQFLAQRRSRLPAPQRLDRHPEGRPTLEEGARLAAHPARCRRTIPSSGFRIAFGTERRSVGSAVLLRVQGVENACRGEPDRHNVSGDRALVNRDLTPERESACHVVAVLQSSRSASDIRSPSSRSVSARRAPTRQRSASR